jgi:hypothetical protein
MVEQVQRWLGINDFAGVKKYGRSESKYSLVLRDGYMFEVGTAEHMLSQRQFEKAIYDNCRVRLPSMKEYIWRRVTDLLQRVAEEELMEDTGKNAQLEEWVEEYLGANLLRGEAVYKGALESREPFVHNGRVHLMATPLRRFVLLGCMEKVTDKELKVLLRQAGFVGKGVTVRVPGREKPVCRYYYSRPFSDDVVPIEREMK